MNDYNTILGKRITENGIVWDIAIQCIEKGTNKEEKRNKLIY